MLNSDFASFPRYHDPQCSRHQARCLTILRAIVGTIFIAHGAQKLFVFGVVGIAGAFGQMGVPFPGVTGPMVALVEFLGGIALLIGLLTRLAELGLDAHDGRRHHAGAPERWVLQPEGFEFPLALAAASLAVVFTGRGRILPRSRAGQAPGALSMPQNQ